MVPFTAEKAYLPYQQKITVLKESKQNTRLKIAKGLSSRKAIMIPKLGVII